MEKQTKNDITEYNDRELSQHFLNDEPLHIRMMTANEDTLRKVAEDSFIFTEAQWNDLLATRKEWIGEGVSQYRKDYVNSKFKAIKDCPHGEPLHYHHDGCPSCETEEEEAKIVSLQGREQYEYLMKRFKYTDEQALKVMMEHNQDVSFLNEYPRRLDKCTDNDLCNAVCNMEDIKATIQREGFWHCPKDNDGTEITIGDCVEDVLNYLHELHGIQLTEEESK